MMPMAGVDRLMGANRFQTMLANRRDEALRDDHLGRASAHGVGHRVANGEDHEMMILLELVITEERFDPHVSL